MPPDRAELRGGELERSVSDEQQVAPLRRADEAEQGAEAVADRPHDRLGDEVRAVREREPGRARARRAVLRDEHVARTQEQLDGRPVAACVDGPELAALASGSAWAVRAGPAPPSRPERAGAIAASAGGSSPIVTAWKFLVPTSALNGRMLMTSAGSASERNPDVLSTQRCPIESRQSLRSTAPRACCRRGSTRRTPDCLSTPHRAATVRIATTAAGLVRAMAPA